MNCLVHRDIHGAEIPGVARDGVVRGAPVSSVQNPKMDDERLAREEIAGFDVLNKVSIRRCIDLAEAPASDQNCPDVTRAAEHVLHAFGSAAVRRSDESIGNTKDIQGHHR